MIAAFALVTGLSACSIGSGDAAGAARAAWEESPFTQASPYAANVQSHVEAMQAGMERARRDLALRAVRRWIEKPG